MMLRSFALLLMLCALSGHGTSNATCNLLEALNGAYDNLDQVQNENSGNDFIQAKFIPTVVSELQNPAVFVDEVVNNRTLRLNAFVLIEGNSTQATLAVYNVTSARFYEKPPGSITADDVSILQLEDLQPFDNSVARVQTIGDCLFIGVLQNSFDSGNGIRSNYVITLLENDFYVVVPPGAPETSSLVPYHFLRRGPRFPGPGEGSNTASECD